MGRSEVASYESEVDKVCSKWVVDVAKELKHCVDTIDRHNKDLRKRISGIQPQGLTEKELKEIPDRINKILNDDSDRIRDVVLLKLTVDVDVTTKKVDVRGYNLSGKLLGIA